MPESCQLTTIQSILVVFLHFPTFNSLIWTTQKANRQMKLKCQLTATQVLTKLSKITIRDFRNLMTSSHCKCAEHYPQTS